MISALKHSEQQTEQREDEIDKQEEHTFIELGAGGVFTKEREATAKMGISGT